MNAFERRMEQDVAQINEGIDRYLPLAWDGQETVCRAMRYSITDGGKRIRPVLTLEFCRLCGGEAETALPFACAVEMIHTYSLIHDDLPCMDDDEMRRGKPSCHIKFGEAYALLAGDALLTLAFETMLRYADPARIPAQQTLRAARILSEEAGCSGMIGGQVIDLKSEGKQVDVDTLRTMDRLKTGALISAAARMGCAVAGADEEKLEAAGRYAAHIGLAFQIVDDILDVTGDAATLGKPVGSDRQKEKSTYVSLLGLDTCRGLVEELTQKAQAVLTPFGAESWFLKELAHTLAQREK